MLRPARKSGARGAGDDDSLVPVLRGLAGLRQQLMRLHAEHRDWRYTYYYQSPLHKRMVADERAIYRALLHFRRMRSRHERALSEVLDGLSSLPRPVPALTYVPSGDLWQHTEQALADLTRFMDLAAEQ